MRLFKVDPNKRLIEPTIWNGRRLAQDLAALIAPPKELLGYVYDVREVQQHVLRRSGNKSVFVLTDVYGYTMEPKFKSWIYKGVSGLPPLVGIGLVVGYNSSLGEFCDCPIGLDQVSFAVEWW